MFDKLLTTSAPAALEAAHEVLRTLFTLYRGKRRQGEAHKEAMPERLPHAGAKPEEGELADTIALEILNEIRTVAQKEVSDLTEEEIEAYTRQLSRVVQERVQSAYGHDEELGKALLKQLRSAYP